MSLVNWLISLFFLLSETSEMSCFNDSTLSYLFRAVITYPVVSFFFFNFYFYFILLDNTVLVFPYIDMNPPQVYMHSQT